MRGLTKGEQSTLLNPVLQLFTRQGSHLVDPFSASFKIDYIGDPESAPSAVITSTAIDLVADKLGTGRFVLLTGSTAAWRYGTHRCVCVYSMVNGGRTYTQVIDFEVLDAVSFPAGGQSYTGYVSTRALYEEGYFALSAVAPEKLHRHIDRESVRIEQLTDRFFEPRYITQKLDGNDKRTLLLDEAIIAIDQVALYDSVAVLETAYGSTDYNVANRHLDGLLNPDDRYNPWLELTYDSLYTGGYWPEGRQNLWVSGVFGFTDPERASDGVLLGHQPTDLGPIIATLMIRFFADPTMSDQTTWRPGSVKKYKTRDQMIEFYGASGNVDYTGGLLADAQLDQMLQRFVKPARLSFPTRRS